GRGERGTAGEHVASRHHLRFVGHNQGGLLGHGLLLWVVGQPRLFRGFGNAARQADWWTCSAQGITSVRAGPSYRPFSRSSSISVARAASTVGLLPARVRVGRTYSSWGRSSKIATLSSCGTAMRRS